MKIEKINDSLYVLEDFIPPLWQDIIEGYFRFDAPWNPVYNVAFDPSDENALKHGERRGYSCVLSYDEHPFPNPKDKAFHFIFPMVLVAFDAIGKNIKDILYSRAFKTPPDYEDADPFHTDHEHEHWVCLYYVHDVDGPTILCNEMWPDVKKGEITQTKFTEFMKSHPKKGKAIVFDGRRYHSSTRSKTEDRIIVNTTVLLDE